ncbi:hypothetical protein BGW39_001216 [Mortierella sp. 14UC]|nr:hypothetical protein BGW39_001216 [Mortierella sp. 14UC]
MDSSSRKRFQPYARPRRQQAQLPDRTREIIQHLPKPVANFVKRSLTWLGMMQRDEDSDPELERELHTTNGDFEFLPDADKEHEEHSTESTGTGDNKASKHIDEDEEHKKLYPDLRDYITTMQSEGYTEEELAAAMAPERVKRRLQLRQELMDSTKGKPIPNHKEETTSAKSTQETLKQETEKPETIEPAPKSAGQTLEDLYVAGAALSPAEINLVMRMRQRAKQAPAGTNPHDLQMLEEYIPNVNAPLYRPRQEFAVRNGRPSQDPYYSNSQDRFARAQLRHEPSDVTMSTQDTPEGRYDRHDQYDRNDTHAHSHSQPTGHRCTCGREVPTGKRTRAARSPTPVSDEDMGTQKMFSHEQEKPKKKRNIRKIAGRFTALESSDEEEDQRNYDLRIAQRKAARDSQSLPSSQDIHGTPTYNHTPPQIYPTLQYGVRTKLYNPKVDEVLKWTASPPSESVVLDTWRCPKCEHRTTKTSSTCKFCHAERPGPPILNTTPISQLRAMINSDELHDIKESITSNPIVSAAISAAPVALGALAAAGISTGAIKGISSLISSDSKEYKDKEATKAVDPPKAPSLFPMPTPLAPAVATPKDAEKENEPEKEKPKITGTWASIGFKGPDNTGKWKCAVCDSHNKDDLDKCGACETARPGVKPAATAPVAPNMFALAAAKGASSSSDSKPPAAPAMFSFGTASSSASPSKPAAASAAAPMFSFGQSSSSSAPTTSAASSPSLFTLPAATKTDGTSAATTPAAGGFVFKAPSTSNPVETKPASNLFGLPPTVSASGDAPKTPSLFSIPSSTATSFEISKPAAANPFSTSTAPVANPFAAPSTSASASTAASTAAPASASSLFGLSTSASVSTPAASKPTTAPVFSFGASSTTTAPTTPTTPMFSMLPSTAAPSFGAKPAATTGAGLFGAGTATSTATSAPLFGNSATTTAAPAFGAITASTPAPAFGATTSAAPSLFGAPTAAAAPASTSSLFGGSSMTSPSKQATSSLFGGGSAAATPTPLGSNLFGTTTTTTGATSAAGTTGSSMFSFSSPSTTFGAKPAATPAPATTAAPSYSFGASTPATSAAAPASIGFGGFGASGTPGFSMTTPASSAAAAKPSPFAFGSATAAPTAAPSFGFGSSTPAVSAAPATSGGFGMNGGFGASAGPTAGSSASPFAFGTNSGAGAFAGFGQTAGASPSTSNTNTSMSMGATPTTPSGSGFGGNSTGGGFSMFGSQSATPGFGGPASTPTIGFGAQGGAGQSNQASPFGQQGGGFGGQSTFNSPMSGTTGGFGASASGMSGFGAPAAPAGGFGAGSITLAGGAGSGFGGQAGAGGFGGAAAGGNTGAFGFQGMPTAPGGAQYTQPSQPAAGGFAFNMGVNTPVPGERKIAKMRKKRNP